MNLGTVDLILNRPWNIGGRRAKFDLNVDKDITNTNTIKHAQNCSQFSVFASLQSHKFFPPSIQINRLCNIHNHTVGVSRSNATHSLVPMPDEDKMESYWHGCFACIHAIGFGYNCKQSNQQFIYLD